MAWYNFWKTKKPVVQETTLVKNTIPLNVRDYSPRKYYAYWEVFNTETPYGHIAEVRFMHRDGRLLEVHSVEGPTKTNVSGLVAKLVTDKMTNFKVQ